MDYNNEDDVKKALGIQSWRNLSRDGVMSLASMMTKMPREVALKIVEQFPQFKALVTDTLKQLDKIHAETLRSNKESQERVHDAYQAVRDAYIAELEKTQTAEERRDLFDRILETADKEAAKDSENKSFLMAALKLTGGVVVAGVVIAASVLGVRSGGLGGSGSDA